MNLAELRSLGKTYEMGAEVRVDALRGVDLAIRAGEYIAVMGPSGYGKSTILNILGCLDRPTEGRYLLEGRVTVKAAGQNVTFGKGDLVVFPKGLSCVWEVTSPVRKHYRFG